MELYYLLLAFLFIVCYAYIYCKYSGQYQNQYIGGSKTGKSQTYSNILIETIKEIKKTFDKKKLGNYGKNENVIEIEIKILPTDLNILWKLYQYAKSKYKPIYSNTSNLIKKSENYGSKISQYEYKDGKLVFVKNYTKQSIHHPITLQIIPSISGKFTFSNEKDINDDQNGQDYQNGQDCQINNNYDLVRNKRRISFQISKNWRMDCTFIGYIHNDIDFFERVILSEDKLEIEFEYINLKENGMCKTLDCNLDEVKRFLNQSQFA